MNIHSPDQDLLLLAHRALPFWRALPAQTHLLVCPHCRARLRRFEGVSRIVAGAVRGRELPPWTGPVGTAVLSAVAGWLLVLVLVVSLTGLLVWGVSHASRHPAASVPVSSGSGGCRPDLPSDKCR